MATSNNDDLFGNLSYVKPQSMYVGLPINEMLQAGKSAHDNYEAVENGFNALSSELSSIDLDNQDKYIVEEIDSNLNSSINRGLENQNFHKMKGELKNQVKSLSKNQLLLTARKARASDLKYIETINAIEGMGELEKNYLLNQHYNSRTQVTYDDNGNVVGGVSRKETIDKWRDIIGELNTEIKDMPADKLFKIVNDYNNSQIAAGKGYFINGTVEELTETEIKEYAKMVLKNSDKYKQQLSISYRANKGDKLNIVNSYELVRNNLPELNKFSLYEANARVSKMTEAEQKALTSEQIEKIKNEEFNKQLDVFFDKLGVKSKFDLTKDYLDQDIDFDLNDPNLDKLITNKLRATDYDGFLNLYSDPVAKYGSYREEDFTLTDDKQFDYNLDIAKIQFQADLALRNMREKAQLEFELEQLSKPTPENPNYEEGSDKELLDGIGNGAIVDDTGETINQVTNEFQINTQSLEDFKNAELYDKTFRDGMYHKTFKVDKVNNYINNLPTTSFLKEVWNQFSDVEKQELIKTTNNTTSIHKNADILLNAIKLKAKEYSQKSLQVHAFNTRSNYTVLRTKDDNINSANASTVIRNIENANSKGLYEYDYSKKEWVKSSNFKANTNFTMFGVTFGNANQAYGEFFTQDGKSYMFSNKNSNNYKKYERFAKLDRFISSHTDKPTMTSVLENSRTKLTLVAEKIYAPNSRFTFKIAYKQKTNDGYIYLNTTNRKAPTFDNIDQNGFVDISGTYWTGTPQSRFIDAPEGFQLPSDSKVQAQKFGQVYNKDSKNFNTNQED